MPMGVSCATSMFQSIMTKTLRGLDVLVYIDAMVAELDINNSNKQQLKKTRGKFEHGLFGGGLGTLTNCKPAHI